MNDTLQHFIVQYANGYTKLQDLLAAQSDKITDNLKIENAKLDQSMQRVVLDSANETVSKVNEHADTKFSSFRDTADAEEAKKRLFRSLKYESMNQRKNQINQEYEKNSLLGFVKRLVDPKMADFERKTFLDHWQSRVRKEHADEVPHI